jgi:hypothetical protein
LDRAGSEVLTDGGDGEIDVGVRIHVLWGLFVSE